MTRAFDIPKGAWDTHIHVFEHGLSAKASPTGAYAPPTDATAADLDAMHRRIGVDFAVVVQNTAETADYDDFIGLLKRNPRFAGMVRYTDALTDRDIENLHAAGTRGVRFSFARFMKQERVSRQVFERTIERIKPFGWHVKVHCEGTDLLELEDWFRPVEIPLLLDHMANLRPEEGLRQPALELLLDLHRKDNVWVLVCNSDRWSHAGPPAYGDGLAMARKVLHNVPERVIWATDWPHPMYRTPRGAQQPAPDDGDLLRFLVEAAEGDPVLLERALVLNPLALYRNQP